MSTYNPYILSLALEDFQFEIKNWSGRIHENIEDLQYALRLGAEATSNMRSMVTYVQAECDTDKELVDESQQAIIESRAHLDEQSKAITQWEKHVDYVSETVHKHRRYWEDELAEAGTWVSDATHALSAAKKQLDKCRSEYERAKRAYDNAAENDKNTRYESQQLQAAEDRLVTAIADHNAAQIELARANARREACEGAVNIVQSAVEQLQNTRSILQDVYRSYGEAESAQSSAESLQQDAYTAHQQETKLVEQAHSNTSQAEEAISTASLHMSRILGIEQEAHAYADGATSAIAHRVDRLRMLDFPDLSI